MESTLRQRCAASMSRLTKGIAFAVSWLFRTCAACGKNALAKAKDVWASRLWILTRSPIVVLAVIGLMHLVPNGKPDSEPPTLLKVRAAAGLGPGQNAPPKGLVLFVHGLGGDYQSTWQNTNGESWMDLMSADPAFNEYSIYTLKYGTSILAEHGGFEKAVRHLREYIDFQWRDVPEIVIVGHSMGGLISQHAIAQSQLRHRPAQRMTFITLATPFRGSALADALDAVSGLSSEDIELLRTRNALTAVGLDYWMQCRRDAGGRLLHFSGYETRKMGGSALVVEKESATAVVSDEFQYAFDDDHSSIAKPADRNSPNYRVVSNWIRSHEAEQIHWAGLPEDAEFKPGNRYVLLPGNHKVKRDLTVPVGAKLDVQPGATVTFAPGVVLHAYGQVLAGRTPPATQTAAVAADPPAVFEFGGGEGTEGGILLDGQHASDSRFVGCVFRGGGGVAITKPNPRTHAADAPNGKWYEVIRRDSKGTRYGGAILAIGAERLQVRDCQFVANTAWQGGGCMLIGCKRANLRGCVFVRNVSGYGGGGVYLQDAEAYFNSCQFFGNRSGPAYRGNPQSQEATTFACGGGIYIGYNSFAEVRQSSLFGNEARHVGGAIYYLGEFVRPQSETIPVLANCLFAHNRTTSANGGGALFLDQRALLNLSECHFVHNTTAGSRDLPGHDILDATLIPSVNTEFRSGLVMNGGNRFFRNEPERGRRHTVLKPPASEQRTGVEPNDDTTFLARRPPALVETVDVLSSPMTNPRCFRASDKREIDTIVVHTVSAVKWDGDAKLAGIKEEEIEPVEEKLGIAVDSEAKYQVRRCKKIFEMYQVATHYLIDRRGKVIQLVRDQDIAFHAGKSAMPPPDGRENVNEFSIGIELVASQPSDDPSVTRMNQFTNEQYTSLIDLLADLSKKYSIKRSQIVGHDKVSLPAGRKKDPGDWFDWKRVLSMLPDDPKNLP